MPARQPFALTLMLLALGLALAFQVRAMRAEPRWQLNTDDAYIHVRLADNLAHTGVLGLNPGERSGGSSSLAWTLLLAAVAAAGLPTVQAAWILSLVFWVLAVRAGARLIGAVFPPGPARWIAGLGLALSGHLLAIALSGLEAPLSLLCVLSSLGAQHDGRWGRAAAWASLATIVRPDGILVAASALLFAWCAPRTEAGAAAERRGAGFVGVASVAALLASVGALAAMGGELPVTFAGRRWLLGLTGGPWEDPLATLRAVGGFAQSLSYHLPQTVGPGYALGVAWVVLLLVLGGAGFVVMLRRGGSQRRIALYVAVHFAAFAFVLPTLGQLGRYFAPVWALLPVFPIIGWTAMRAWRPARRHRGLTEAVAVALTAGYAPQVVHWSQWNAAAIHHLAAVHHATAEWVAEHVPPEEAIGAFDIGILAWTIPNRVVGLGGITSRAGNRALREGTVPEYLRREGVDTVVVPQYFGAARWSVAHRMGFDENRLRELHRETLAPGEAGHVWRALVAAPALGVYRFEDASPE